MRSITATLCCVPLKYILWGLILDSTPENRADEYLWKMADEDNAVKDKRIKKVRLGEDFGSALTW